MVMTKLMFGLIDFNNNGVFDDNEVSEFTEVTNEGDYTVTFRNHPLMNDDTVLRS